MRRCHVCRQEVWAEAYNNTSDMCQACDEKAEFARQALIDEQERKAKLRG